jgi:hypothetical protein
MMKKRRPAFFLPEAHCRCCPSFSKHPRPPPPTATFFCPLHASTQPVQVLPVVCIIAPGSIAQHRPVCHQQTSGLRLLPIEGCPAVSPQGLFRFTTQRITPRLTHDCRSCFTPGEDVWLRLFSRHGRSPHSREVYCTAFYSLPGLALLCRHHHPVVRSHVSFPFVLLRPSASARRSEDILTPQGNTAITAHGLLFSPGNGCHGYHSGSIKEGPSFSAPDVLNSESRCTPSSSQMEQKQEYHSQTFASTIVSIARENT